MTWRDRLNQIPGEVPDDDLPAFVGELARLQAEAGIRIVRNGAARPDALKCYTAAQVADLLERNVSWVRRHRDELGAIKADGAVLYPEAGIRRFLERRR